MSDAKASFVKFRIADDDLVIHRRFHSDHSQYGYWTEAVALIGTDQVSELGNLISATPALLWFATQDDEHLLLIHLAARVGDLDAIKILVDAGVDIDVPSGAYVPIVDGGRPYFEPGYSPLMIAALAGQINAMKFLAARGAKLHARATVGGSMLHVCASSRSLDVVRTMIDLQAAMPRRAYPSRLGTETVAALEAQSKLIDQLDDCNIDGKSVGTSTELTPLQFAVVLNDLPCVNALIDGGAGLDVVNDYGHTALFLAVMLGFYDIAEALLKSGADPNIREALGTFVITSDRTAWHVATQRDDDSMKELLARYGADSNLAMLAPGSSKPFPSPFKE